MHKIKLHTEGSQLSWHLQLQIKSIRQEGHKVNCPVNLGEPQIPSEVAVKFLLRQIIIKAQIRSLI